MHVLERAAHSSPGNPCRGVPSATVGNVVIRWQELITITSSPARATTSPWATSPSRTGRKTSEASLPSIAAGSVQ